MTHPKYLFAKALQLSFIILKLCSVIAWSWWWVLAPLWITVFVFPLFLYFIGYFIKQDVDGLTGGVLHVTTRVYHCGKVIYKNSSSPSHTSGISPSHVAFVKQQQREWAKQFIKDYKTLS